jgi:hypothetical protein|tara:strand:- start:47 stop:310 length:264 start_codon:yes stop_codon:yes gene_type:complete
MKNFRVQIRSRGYYADFNLTSEDNDTAFENALVDKLGQNDIVWEKDGFSNPFKTWITYEEVIDATTSQGLIQAEEESRDRMGGSSAR